MDTRYDGIRHMNDDPQPASTSVGLGGQTPGQTNGSPNSDASQLLRVEELVRTHVARSYSLKAEISKAKEMLDNAFENDPTFKEHERLAKEAAQVRTKTRFEILKIPAVAALDGKIKELKAQSKELKDGLGEYLADYQRLSGSNTIEIDGEVQEIIYVPKLVKKSTFRP